MDELTELVSFQVLINLKTGTYVVDFDARPGAASVTKDDEPASPGALPKQIIQQIVKILLELEHRSGKALEKFGETGK